MIYAVTFNPALGYMVTVGHFTLGNASWAIRKSIPYKGKGINAPASLANLGYRSTALDFMAGFTGREIERGIRSLGFDSDLIQVEKDTSRINVKLKSGQESKINSMGSEIMDGDVKRLSQKLSYLKEGDMLVLSGSIPAVVDNDIYRRTMEHLDDRGVYVAVDAEKDLLQKVLQYYPFLTKPNNHELGQIFGQELKIEGEIVLHARKLKEQGTMNAPVSMAGDRAMLTAEDGSIHRQGVARGAVKNSVGAEDSMMAGFIAGYLEKGDYAYALKLGTACGGATVFSDGIGTEDETMRLLSTL